MGKTIKDKRFGRFKLNGILVPVRSELMAGLIGQREAAAQVEGITLNYQKHMQSISHKNREKQLQTF